MCLVQAYMGVLSQPSKPVSLKPVWFYFLAAIEKMANYNVHEEWFTEGKDLIANDFC